MRTDTNERAEIKELRGVASESLRGALCEMEAVASGTRTTKPFYHASINTRADEPLTDTQREQAIDRLEIALGLSGQSRVVVVHLKEGREHCHIVWSRIDLDRMRAISDRHNYRKHEEVARELEREFGHGRVQGAHVERESKERPERTPSHSEMLQTSRGAVSPAEAKALISELWQQTDDGKSFKAALEDRGWILARGDRRDFVALDPYCGTHSLARRVAGAKAQDARERMADIDSMSLPTVAVARNWQREHRARTVNADGLLDPLLSTTAADLTPLDLSDLSPHPQRIRIGRGAGGGGMVPQQRAANKAFVRANPQVGKRPQSVPTNADRPLTAAEIQDRHSDPVLNARYDRQDQERKRQSDPTTTPADVAAQGDSG